MKSNSQNTIRNSLSIILLAIMISQTYAQQEEISIWPEGIPNSIHSADYQEVYNKKEDQLKQVTNPTLTVFVPENPNGTSVIVCPGGGYAYLAINKEGYKVAEWLNTLGITAFVLKYRLPSDAIMKDKSIGPLQDAQEAIRYIRRNAEKWKINKEKIGVMGFSAGGHLASTVSTHYRDQTYVNNDGISAKPNFTVLAYPVISMEEKMAHKGSRNKLLGNNPSEEVKVKFSSERQVDSLTPPAFLVHASDDKGVIVENSIAYYLALKEHNIPAELHIYEDGKHGFGLGKTGTSQYWTKQCELWFRTNEYIN